MDITTNVTNKQVLISFTDDEWKLVKWIRNVYGVSVFNDLLARFMQQKAEQRKANMKDEFMATFISAPPATKQQILTMLGMTYEF
jgi:sulfur relay (sulfurtransferase) DsrC/TusE family protein